MENYKGKAVLITGGTQGIGLATGLTFARQGAHCILTYRWGNHDEAEILAKFKETGGPAPLLISADVAKSDETDELLLEVKKHHSEIHAFINNVSVAMNITDFKDYTKKGLYQSLDYTSWPLVEYTKKIKETFGKYPKYIVSMSSGGPDHFYVNYDFVAASKAVLETFCKYLAYRLKEDGVRVNVIRSRLVKTESLDLTFGEEFANFVKKYAMKDTYMPVQEIADAAFGLCSGFFDGMTGQVIMVDRGTTFADNLMRLFIERKKFGL